MLISLCASLLRASLWYNRLLVDVPLKATEEPTRPNYPILIRNSRTEKIADEFSNRASLTTTIGLKRISLDAFQGIEQVLDRPLQVFKRRGRISHHPGHFLISLDNLRRATLDRALSNIHDLTSCRATTPFHEPIL
jgi:hypothetical protein